jgi:hypothetical protein
MGGTADVREINPGQRCPQQLEQRSLEIGHISLLVQRLRNRIEASRSGMTDEVVVAPGGGGLIEGKRAVFVAGDP